MLQGAGERIKCSFSFAPFAAAIVYEQRTRRRVSWPFLFRASQQVPLKGTLYRVIQIIETCKKERRKFERKSERITLAELLARRFHTVFNGPRIAIVSLSKHIQNSRGEGKTGIRDFRGEIHILQGKSKLRAGTYWFDGGIR